MIYSFCMHFYFSKLTFFHTTRIFCELYKTRDFELTIVSYHFCLSFPITLTFLKKQILHYLNAVKKFISVCIPYRTGIEDFVM
jgi:hypothetical protein